MKKYLEKKDFQEIRSWVYRNARPLELALWQYHFENGCKEAVLSVLELYQNDDGGFGKSIEPDNWNPESTPYNCSFVLGILKQINFYDLEHPFYQGIFKFLRKTEYQGQHGWFFSVPDSDLYPHAIWWSYDEEGNTKQNIGITASLSGFILRHTPAGSELYDIALKYTDMLLKKLKDDDSHGEMGVFGYSALYQDLVNSESGKRFDLDFLEMKTRSLIKAHFHQYVWTNHQDMATALPTPNLYYYEGYEQNIMDALDELITIRPEKGVWPIPWEWYDNGAYVREFAIAEYWWKAHKAIEKILFIKAHGRFRV